MRESIGREQVAELVVSIWLRSAENRNERDTKRNHAQSDQQNAKLFPLRQPFKVVFDPGECRVRSAVARSSR